jgi:peptide/nickel transport system permease protein
MALRTGLRAAPVPARYRNAPLLWGCGIIFVLVVGSFVIPAISAYSAWKPDATAALQSPNSSHLFGTDISGFDMFTRVFYAPRYDLSIAGAGVLIGALIGVTVGVAAGFTRGLVGEFVMRAADLVQALPSPAGAR